MGLLMLIGALLWYRPAMTSRSDPVAEVPNPTAVFSAARYTLPPEGRACMPNVAVTPDSRQVVFSLFPIKRTRHGGPPVEFVLRGSGYRTATRLHGGYPGGSATLPITPPSHSLLVTACFINVGHRPVSMVGTDEARTISRSIPLTLDGTQQPGDIAFTFLTGRSEDSLDLLGTIAVHASNLTDGLLSPLLVWIIGVLTAFGVPVLVVLAFRSSLAEAEPEPQPDGARSA
jgi:hypothetical protein